MQATSHVNRICLSQSAVSVHCFHAYSKGSRVSLQSTQTSWTFTWLRVLLSYYLLRPRLASRSSPLLSDRTVCSGHVGWSVLFWRTSCFEADPTCNFLLHKNLFELGIYERVVCAKTHPMLQSAPSKRCSDTKSLERDWTLWYKDTKIITIIIVHMHTQAVENRHKTKYWILKTVFRCC